MIFVTQGRRSRRLTVLAACGAAAAFVAARATPGGTTAAPSPERLSYVQRYAWFALAATPGDGSAGLFLPGPVATRVGRAFQAVDSRR
ncbi:MAG TPA: hypothetical protein VGR98_28325 [Streptosporangiaceae bacterium]|nr:hypothetical protein [Streptosporangiaceae bacterium]